MDALIGTIITGAIIGVIARFFMRGRQNISILWTIVCGAIGAAVGNWAAVQLDALDPVGLRGNADHLPVPGHDRQEVTYQPNKGSLSFSHRRRRHLP